LKILGVIFVVVVVIIVGLVIYNKKKNENTDGIADREAISLATPSKSS
jgi:Na+/proline symporter